MKSCTTSWNNVQLELQSLKAIRYGMIYARIAAKKYVSKKKINNVTNTVVQRIEHGTSNLAFSFLNMHTDPVFTIPPICFLFCCFFVFF